MSQLMLSDRFEGDVSAIYPYFKETTSEDYSYFLGCETCCRDHRIHKKDHVIGNVKSDPVKYASYDLMESNTW